MANTTTTLGERIADRLDDLADMFRFGDAAGGEVASAAVGQVCESDIGAGEFVSLKIEFQFWLGCSF